ncbi:MAG: 50S ribosomal protein P1 [Candidatus Thermoplasmatota archaeon]
MEYIYTAMLLHSAGKKINEENLKKVLDAAGVKADDGRIKALTASLEDVDIEEAMKSASVPTAAAAQPSTAEKTEEKEEEKKEEEEEEEEDVSEEEAAEGLGSLFD